MALPLFIGCSTAAAAAGCLIEQLIGELDVESCCMPDSLPFATAALNLVGVPEGGVSMGGVKLLLHSTIELGVAPSLTVVVVLLELHGVGTKRVASMALAVNLLLVVADVAATFVLRPSSSCMANVERCGIF